MSRFDRIFDVTCACCKADGADVPEVEAVISLLFSGVQAAYRSAIDAILDAVALIRPEDDESLALLLAAYVTTSRRRNVRLLSPAAEQVAAQAAGRLWASSAQRAGLPVPEVGTFPADSVDRLQVMVRDLIERAVEETVTTAAGLAQAGLTAPGPTGSTEVLRTQLEEALDAERVLRPLLDAWAYQTYNIAAIRAAAADGHNFIQLQATVDNVTTAFCRLVDGRVVPMRRALAQLDRIQEAVAAGDAEALMSAAPFHKDPKNATKADVDAALERGGLAPFHHGCRTRNVPIRLDQ